MINEGKEMDNRIATRDDWEIEDMPEKSETFIINRCIGPKQMEMLRHGNIPQEMEDKWFWYMEENKLYAYRSWTGICIYIIEFKDDDNHVVTVNRDPRQYSCTAIEDDREQINKLLDWWSQEPYDYYGEWISETVDALHKSS